MWPRLKNKNPLAGAYRGKKALIVGTAQCFYEDLKGVNYGEYEVFGLNDIAVYFPHLAKNLVSMHPTKVRWYVMLGSKHEVHASGNDRHIKLIHDRFKTHSTEQFSLVDHVWNFEDGGGSSSLFAVKICMVMGFDLIHLVGCPMDDSPRFTIPPGMKVKHDYAQKENWGAWEKNKEYMQGRVFSRSGRTKELLGGF